MCITHVVLIQYVTIRQTAHTHTILHYSNPKSYVFRLHETAIFKLHFSEIEKGFHIAVAIHKTNCEAA
jgi:methionine-rich copper-binding protein CopC